MLIIFFHFLTEFFTFSLFFDISHQNHPKTASLFNRISHFLTVFCHFLSLFRAFSRQFSALVQHLFTPNQRTCATPLPLHSAFKIQHPKFPQPAHFRNLLL